MSCARLDAASAAIFIHGIARRSGTNYLRWLLACHPQVAVSPQQIWEFPHLSRNRHLVSYAEDLMRSKKLPGIDQSSVLAALGDGLLGLAHRGLHDSVRVLIKEPSVDGIEKFFDFFPNAHLVLLIRDGRDVSDSLSRTRFGGEPLTRWRRWAAALGMSQPARIERAKAWSQSSRQIAAVCDAQSGPWQKQCTLVRYEDLVENMSDTMERLLGRLQLERSTFDWEAACRLKIRGSSFAGVVDARQGLNWHGVDPGSVDFAPVGRWRNWPTRDRRAFLRVAGSELQRWGYPIDS